MIEDKKDGIKIATNEYDKLIPVTEQRIKQTELSAEIDRVVLDYLKKKSKEIEDGKDTK